MGVLGLIAGNWRWILMALLVAAVGFYKWRFEHERSQFGEFRTQVRAEGLAAEMRAKEIALRDLKRKEHADAENATTVANLATTIKRLRDANTYRLKLPAAPATSSRPDLLCLDRAEYQREDGEITKRLREGARSLADEGSKNTLELNNAKEWARRP